MALIALEFKWSPQTRPFWRLCYPLPIASAMPVQHHPECLVRVMAGGLVDQLAEPAVYQRSIIIRSSRAPRACPHLCPPDSLTSPTVLDAGRGLGAAWRARGAG